MPFLLLRCLKSETIDWLIGVHSFWNADSFNMDLACKYSLSQWKWCDNSAKVCFDGRCAPLWASRLLFKHPKCFHLLLFCVCQRENVAREQKVKKKKIEEKNELHTTVCVSFISRTKHTAKRNENKSFRFGRYAVSRTNGKYSSV